MRRGRQRHRQDRSHNGGLLEGMKEDALEEEDEKERRLEGR